MGFNHDAIYLVVIAKRQHYYHLLRKPTRPKIVPRGYTMLPAATFKDIICLEQCWEDISF